MTSGKGRARGVAELPERLASCAAFDGQDTLDNKLLKSTRIEY